MSDYFDGYDKGYQEGYAERYDEVRQQVVFAFATADTPDDFIQDLKDLFQIWS